MCVLYAHGHEDVCMKRGLVGEAVGVCYGWGRCGYSTLVETVRGVCRGKHSHGRVQSGQVCGMGSLAPE